MNKINDFNLKGKLDILHLQSNVKTAFLILYIIVLAFTVLFGVYLLTYFLFIFLFLIVASSLGGYKFFDKIVSSPTWQKILMIFMFAFILRALMLGQTQIICEDLENYIYRSENLLDGRIPYTEYDGGSKPPLYQYMLYLMGFVFTPGKVQFRAVFSVFDSLIAVALYFLCKTKYDERFSVVASLIYALFPVGIISIGLSGHYDPVVILFTLFAMLMLLKNRLGLSSLSLGTAFALKLYPIVLLPFFLTTIKTWRSRIIYTILFLVPSIASHGLLYILSPDAFFEYFAVQSKWDGSSAFSSTIETILGTSTIFSIKISWLGFLFFGFLNLLLLLDWLSPNRHKNLIKWFKIIIVIYMIYYGFYLIYGVLYYGGPLYMALILAEIYFLFMVFILHKYLDIIAPKSLTDFDSEGLFVVSTFSIMLFIFGLPNYVIWYFLWFLPFLLAIKTDRIRYILLWLFPWHGIGQNVSLAPGTPPVN
ncbi:MAG: glycosyltransferase family 39 protein [Thermoplasmata archaeon]|nr:MAG: glycosyltransferase family 39 protein [Thermoplasmata archaeon]